MTRIHMRYGRDGKQEVRVHLSKGEVVDEAMARWLRAHAGRVLIAPSMPPSASGRALSYNVADCVSVRRLFRTRPPSGKELLVLLEDLLHALELRPWVGCRAPVFALDARWVFVDDRKHLRLVCLPFERVTAKHQGSVLTLLRLMSASGLGKRTPGNRVVYERLHAFVNDQGSVFSLNLFRSFVASLAASLLPVVESGPQGEGFVLKNEKTGVMRPLACGHTYVLGRDERCEVRFADEPQVSREHARLCCERDGLTLTDTNSTNGTFVEGRRLVPHRATRVNYGQHFALCNVNLCVERG